MLGGSQRFFVVLQEGKQASLAADFSITQFRHIGRLLMVHGRNSYKRSAALGQFVMHRGLIISTMQVSMPTMPQQAVASLRAVPLLWELRWTYWVSLYCSEILCKDETNVALVFNLLCSVF